MTSIPATAVTQYEQIVTETLTAVASLIPTASGSSRDVAYVVDMRELLNRVKETVDSGLNKLQMIDAQYVKCVLLGKPYEGINVGSTVAAVGKKQDNLPTVLGNLLTEYVDDLEFKRTGQVIQATLGANNEAVATRERRNEAIEAVRVAMQDIKNERAPQIDAELQKHVAALHSIPDIEVSLKGATTAQLDVALTFLQQHCPELRAFTFPEGASLALGLMHKLGTFPNLKRLAFSKCNVDDGMMHVLAEKLSTLRELSIKGCQGITEAAFTAQDARGTSYAERFKELTHLYLGTIRNFSDLGLITLFSSMTALIDLQLVGWNLSNDHVTCIATNLPDLLHLTLSGNRLNDAAFTEQTISRLRGLHTLDLCGCASLSDRTLNAIAPGMPKLTTLGLPPKAELRPETTQYVGSKLRHLYELRFICDGRDHESISKFRAGLPALFSKAKNIKSLVATTYSSLNEKNIITALVPYLPQLTSLTCYGLRLTELFYCDATKPHAVNYGELLKGLHHLHLLGDIYSSEFLGNAILSHMHQLLSLALSEESLGNGMKERLLTRFPFAQITKSGY